MSIKDLQSDLIADLSPEAQQVVAGGNFYGGYGFRRGFGRGFGFFGRGFGFRRFGFGRFGWW